MFKSNKAVSVRCCNRIALRRAGSSLAWVLEPGCQRKRDGLALLPAAYLTLEIL